MKKMGVIIGGFSALLVIAILLVIDGVTHSGRFLNLAHYDDDTRGGRRRRMRQP